MTTDTKTRPQPQQHAPVDTHGRVRRTKPDCLNGYGDGPRHCTLVVGHAGPCNHLGAEVTP